MPFTEELGIEVLESTTAVVSTRLAWAAEKCTANGALHGGALMALADATGGMCAFLNLPDGGTGTSTIESKTNFLRPLTSGYATATAQPLHIGRRTIVVETEIRGDNDKLVAKVTQTQAVL
ncbi:MAG TPA: PaaI family thioesterase [Pseudonocardiaceae bacterium]